MIFIAVCDDDFDFAKRFGDAVKEGFELRGVTCKAVAYDDSCNLFEDLEKQYFDIICLDIEMGKDNGVTIANIIRDKFKNQKSQIVFISSHISYHQSGVLYDAAPMAFVQKPFETKDIENIVSKTISRIVSKSQNEDRFTFNFNSTKYSLLKRNIVYIEGSGRKKIIHTVDKNYHLNMNMKEIIKTIDDSDFILVHQSYLVNLDYIQTINRHNVVCKTGDILDISATYYKKALLAVADFAERKGME